MPCMHEVRKVAKKDQLTSIEESLKNSSSISSTETPETSTFCDVAMTYAWLARLRGTPLILYGPVEI